MACPGCPPDFRPVGGAGGLRFRPMGSDEGGLEELVELRLSRASRSATRCSSSAIRHRSDSKPAKRAACASGGTVFQSDSGIGSVRLIHSDYVLTVQKVRSVSAYDHVDGNILDCRKQNLRRADRGRSR